MSAASTSSATIRLLAAESIVYSNPRAEPQMLDVRHRPRRQIVENVHLAAARDQRLSQVRPDESGATGDQEPRHGRAVATPDGVSMVGRRSTTRQPFSGAGALGVSTIRIASPSIPRRRNVDA